MEASFLDCYDLASASFADSALCTYSVDTVGYLVASETVVVY